jgi:hypothetical protein
MDTELGRSFALDRQSMLELLELSRRMVDDSSTLSPALCSVGDLGRRPPGGSNVDREGAPPVQGGPNAEAKEVVPPDAGTVSQALGQVGFVARSISGR